MKEIKRIHSIGYKPSWWKFPAPDATSKASYIDVTDNHLPACTIIKPGSGTI